ncbi:putative addiction module component (TIGR02574 family) [Mucilaginibacter yixingensis]|uniref:Putative addiction module component (TIGR02574 family) n=1 Tax=Mucilaginibacter yixingensis TaxID=1295612 RepID=A0A2T5JDY6_9SPHI|nr:addiction module protein [Mucilaginibacter yixingensis]PTQ99990.1 putative addiction module component (TIGR02574 family) [Mucilaginibacter yixingensis]
MSIAEIKQKLHEYIDTAEDEQLLEAVYDLLENGGSPERNSLTAEQWEELDRRMEEYQNGSAKIYDWEDAAKKIESSLKKK